VQGNYLCPRWLAEHAWMLRLGLASLLYEWEKICADMCSYQ